LLGRLRLLERSSVTIGVDGGGRDDNERPDQLLQSEQLLGVLSLEGDEVDQDIRALAERLLEGGRIGTVDLDVLDAGRKLVFTAVADYDLPPTPLEPRDQRPSGLAGAAEKKCAPRHRRDDSSLIF